MQVMPNRRERICHILGDRLGASHPHYEEDLARKLARYKHSL